MKIFFIHILQINQDDKTIAKRMKNNPMIKKSILCNFVQNFISPPRVSSKMIFRNKNMNQFIKYPN